MDTPGVRLEALLRADAVRLTGDPTLMESHSNDTWLASTPEGLGVVLRVCWIGDRERILREAAVGSVLPVQVGYPTVLAAGSLPFAGDRLTWMLTERLRGTSLAQAWPTLGDTDRERALREVAAPLRALHAWRPPADVLSRLGPPPVSSDPDTLIGRTLLPLPLDRVRHLVRPALERAPDHRVLISQAWTWLVDHADLIPRLDDPDAGALIHGDLHLANVWWDGGQVSGLLDLEWVRLGPAWVDLSQALDNALAGDELSGAHARLSAVLRQEMPELEVPDLDRRLVAVELAMQIRQVLVWSPPGPDPVGDHPVRILQRLLDLS